MIRPTAKLAVSSWTPTIPLGWSWMLSVEVVSDFCACSINLGCLYTNFAPGDVPTFSRAFPLRHLSVWVLPKEKASVRLRVELTRVIIAGEPWRDKKTTLARYPSAERVYRLTLALPQRAHTNRTCVSSKMTSLYYGIFSLHSRRHNC